MIILLILLPVWVVSMFLHYPEYQSHILIGGFVLWLVHPIIKALFFPDNIEVIRKD